MAEGEEGSSHPHKNGSAQLILTVDSYRCNRTGLGGSQGRSSSCQPGREHFGFFWQCNAPLVKNDTLCNPLLKQEKLLPTL